MIQLAYVVVGIGMIGVEEFGEMILSLRGSPSVDAILREHRDAIGWMSIIAPMVIAYLIAFFSAKHLWRNFREKSMRSETIPLGLAIVVAMIGIANALRLWIFELKGL